MVFRQLKKFLTASTEEMKMALRAMETLFKRTVPKGSVSFDSLTAKMIGIPFSFDPWENYTLEK